MSLMRCPECGKEISDKSEKCIHCGYPISTSNICMVNGKEYDLSFLVDDSYSVLYKVRDLIQISNSDINHVKPIVEKIIQEKSIPKFLNLPIKIQQNDNVPKCIYCGSTNIKKIGLVNRGMSSVLWGLGSKKIGKQFHCNNCGSDF